jgi:predicted ribosomally synthesized peptide with nif11-like leader
MTIKEGLAFLSQARRDESLVSKIEELDGEVSLEGLTRVANEAGYDFTPEELQRAHALDWRMRWARYQP